jgi:hypothetical protein
MRALALEILRRKLSVTWWTKHLFRKVFSEIWFVKASGCIAVSGGLEVALGQRLSI